MLRYHWEAVAIGGRIIKRLILETCSGVVWTGLSWLRIGLRGRLM
jgi:hypothetical protein